MAEPTPNESAATDEARPKLVAVDPKTEPKAPRPQTPPPPEAQPAESGRAKRGARRVIWLLAALLVVALSWAGLQSQQLQAAQQRNLALSEQIQGLEVQLSAATLQLHGYEMRQELVRSVATELQEQVNRLQELVNPAPPPAVETGTARQPLP
jgi:uncharacterized protein HemX